MKRLTLFCSLTVGLLACTKVQQIPTPVIPSIQGTMTIAPNPTAGPLTMSFSIEPNQKYSVIVTDMSGKSYKTYSVSSIESTFKMYQNMDFLSNGNYDLILIDITGNETKTPLIIKK